ncbi:MAG: RIP metalloprotease RseP [Bacteroidaceae bacterium]|nr:RIP metalloprotease RseP [Bacteroidaceae bacterium]
MEEVLIKALQLIVALSLLVVLHEGGHFLFAKLFKVRVKRFYLFFDFPFYPKPQFSILTFKNGKLSFFVRRPELTPEEEEAENNVPDGEFHTEYGIGYVPLGGYVDLIGMIDENKKELAAETHPWEFRTKPAWQRLLIMLGGILMNFLTAFFIYAMVLFAWGESYVKSADMEYGMKFSETAKADGFRDGDIFLKIDDEVLESWTTARLQDLSNAKTATVLRDGKEKVITLPAKMSLLDMIQEQPMYASPLMPHEIDSVFGEPAIKAGLKKGDHITAINGTPVADHNDIQYQLHLLSEGLNERSTAVDSLKRRTVSLVVNGKDTVSTVLTSDFLLGYRNIDLYDLYKDKIYNKEYGFFESFPAGVKLGWGTITSYVDQLKYLFTKKGARSVGGFIGIGKIFPDVWDWYKFWMLTAFLSVALGVMNLLPIPALDGGHAIITIYEMITRRKPSEKFLERVQMIGMWLLIGLMILANGNDILRLFGL